MAWLLCVTLAAGQTSYTGMVDKYPIEFVVYVYGDGVAIGAYGYTRLHNPIELQGKLDNNTLTLYEKDKAGKNTAQFTFPAYNSQSHVVTGVWTSLTNQKELKTTLNYDFEIPITNNEAMAEKGLIQTQSLKTQYFKLGVVKKAGEFEARVARVTIIDKKTNQPTQQIDVDCRLLGVSNISVGDYNFDGYEDFSVFETSYAGANTSSLYFLYGPETKMYFNSGYEGTSLSFDPKTKTITEDNQCCAGSIVTRQVYTVVNNKMVAKEKHCLKWSEKKQDYIERPWKECN